MIASTHPEAAVSHAVIPALDGVRALALLLVMLYHANLLGCGWIGVQVFFVLSGFLITRVLWRDGSVGGLWAALGRFWARRALRIFPAFYLFLAVVGAVALWRGEGVSGVQWVLAATYTYNIARGLADLPGSHALDHVWSLAVEEHVYLLWPLVVLGLSGVGFRRLALTLLVAAPVFRLLVLVGVVPASNAPFAVAMLTPSYLDAFAAGALACWLVESGRAAWLRGWMVLAVIAVGGLAGAAVAGNAILAPAQTFGAWATLGWPNTLPNGWQAVWGYSWIHGATALALLWLAARHPNGVILASMPMRRIGRVSYAGYLWHFPLAHAMSPLVFEIHHATGWGFYTCLVAWFPVFALAVYSCAEASYWLVERPCLRARHRFRASMESV